MSVGVLNSGDIRLDPPLPLPMQDALNSMSPCCNAFLKAPELSLRYPCEGQVRAWKTCICIKCITLCVVCFAVFSSECDFGNMFKFRASLRPENAKDYVQLYKDFCEVGVCLMGCSVCSPLGGP